MFIVSSWGALAVGFMAGALFLFLIISLLLGREKRIRREAMQEMMSLLLAELQKKDK